MKKIKRDTIVDEVYAMLRKAIEEGQFEPGDRIYEDRLLEKLDVSKTPLRSALHQLRREGVVRIAPRKGIYLAIPSTEQLLELIEMREVLEGLSARRCALRSDRQFVDAMLGCFAGFDEDDLLGRRLEYAAADFSFHSILMKESASSELETALRTINLRIHQYRLDPQKPHYDLRTIHRQHLEIIDAIRAGNATAAEDLARAHVRLQRDLMTSGLNAEKESPEARTKNDLSNNALAGIVPQDTIEQR